MEKKIESLTETLLFIAYTSLSHYSQDSVIFCDRFLNDFLQYCARIWYKPSEFISIFKFNDWKMNTFSPEIIKNTF